jgi:hypothetical protein
VELHRYTELAEQQKESCPEAELEIRLAQQEGTTRTQSVELRRLAVRTVVADIRQWQFADSSAVRKKVRHSRRERKPEQTDSTQLRTADHHKLADLRHKR